MKRRENKMTEQTDAIARVMDKRHARMMREGSMTEKESADAVVEGLRGFIRRFPDSPHVVAHCENLIEAYTI